MTPRTLSLLVVLFLSFCCTLSPAAFAQQNPSVEEAKAFHHSELKKKRTVTPKYPKAAKKKFSDVDTEHGCKVQMFIDALGVPSNLTFESCDPVFHKNTRKALMQWLFEPATDAQGQPVPAQFVLMIRYRNSGGTDQEAPQDTPPPQEAKQSTSEPTRTVDSATVTKISEVAPFYPQAAKDLDLGDVVCKTRLLINDRGIPQTVLYDDCPEVFHFAVKHALLQWRFVPVQDEEGHNVAAYISLDNSFQAPDKVKWQANPKSEFKVIKTRMVQPEYPEAAKKQNVGDHVCKVRIFIDTSGVPYAVKFEKCLKVFHISARKALMKWRFSSARDTNNKPVKAQFMLKIKYQLLD